jgi:membrane-associated phospholipid phosphatase
LRVRASKRRFALSSHTSHGMTNDNDRYLPVDKATFLYMAALSLLILVFHANLPNWAVYLGFNLCICLAVVLIAHTLNSRAGGFAFFFRHWYPLLFFTLLYEETRYLIHLIFPHPFDPLINQLELAVFGVYPTVWAQKLIYPGLNEFMMFSYSSYYFLLAALGLGLFLRRKFREFDGLFFTSAVAYYVSYLGFILFPVEGPRFALLSQHQIELNGGFFTSLAQGLIHMAGIQGAAMPSSHVAVAFVLLVYARRHHRTFYWVLLPLVISLTVSTIYGRFHYVSDVMAGMLVAAFSILLCDRVIKREDNFSKQDIPQKEFSLDLARSD